MSNNNTETVEKVVVQSKKRRKSELPKVSVALKRLWKAEGQGLSFKVFVRSRAKSGDANAKRWFENRSGKHDAKTSERNVQLARICFEASKNARKKTKK